MADAGAMSGPLRIPAFTDDELQRLYTWVDEIPLSRPKRNISRDFSDGVLMAEVAAHFFPRLVDLHNYSSANSVKQKLYNWATLNQKVFRKLRFEVTKEEIEAAVNARPGMVEAMLMRLKTRIEEIHVERSGHAPGTADPYVTSPGGAGGAGSGAGGGFGVPASAARVSSGPGPFFDDASAARGAPVVASVAAPVGASRAVFATPVAAPAVASGGAGGGGGGAPLASSSLEGVRADTSLLLERERRVKELEETVEFLELKVKKLEQLVRLKESRIQTLQAKLQTQALGVA